MFELSPRFFASPRFLALPAIAVAVIVALAYSGPRPADTAGMRVAAPIYRAVNCANPANAANAACTVAADTSASRVR